MKLHSSTSFIQLYFLLASLLLTASNGQAVADDKFIQVVLESHYNRRAAHSAPPLTINAEGNGKTVIYRYKAFN